MNAESADKTATKKAKKDAASSAKRAREGRFVGWQKSPIHQSTFGKTTKGGSNNTAANYKNSTGPVQKSNSAWYIIDASQVPVGRFATVAASILMGKHRPDFTPGAGSGDAVIVINAKEAFFSSNKADKKMYYWHTGYFGGLKMETARVALQKHPEKVIYDAVYGMMPKTNLSRKQLVHLKIYPTADHPHKAQQPIELDLTKSNLKSLAIA